MPEMDPGIWRNLPEELLYHILTFLSPKTIFHLRSTCKRFKSLLFDPAFISNYAFSSSTFSSFLLLSHPHFNRQFPLYDTLSATWRHSLRNPCTASSALLAASNGLLCFSCSGSSAFLITNPLSRATKLVKFPTLPFSFEIITLVSLPTGFKIFTVSSSSSVFLYDSRSSSWVQSHLGGLHSKILNDSFHQGGVYSNGELYFTTCDPFSVVSFNLVNCHWQPRSQLPTNELAFVRLVSGEDRLYMVGGVGSNGISRCLKLWDMDQDGNNWVEIERLPEMMYKRLVSVCYHNYEHIYCYFHQGMICICCYTYPEVLYYRISRRTWHWIPKCPALPEKWSCGFRWFSFVPTLHAPV